MISGDAGHFSTGRGRLRLLPSSPRAETIIVWIAAMHTPLPRMGWTGRAPAANGSQSRMGLRRTRGARAMSRTTSAVAASTIGIDTGKHTLHLIGLDEQGVIVLREKLARGRIGGRLANVPPCLIGINWRDTYPNY